MGSPHTVQFDLDRAIQFNIISDPGPGAAPIYIDRQLGILLFNIKDNEARAILQPDKPGKLCLVQLRSAVASKSLTLTVQGTYDGSNSAIVLPQSAGTPWVLLYSIGTTPGAGVGIQPNPDVCQWRVLNNGAGVTGTGLTAPTQTQTALTDNTGGAVSTTLASITAGSSYLQADLTAAKNSISSLAAELVLVRADVAAILSYLAK